MISNSPYKYLPAENGHKAPLSFWFNHFLDSMAEINQIFSLFFWKFETQKSHSEINFQYMNHNYMVHKSFDLKKFRTPIFMAMLNVQMCEQYCPPVELIVDCKSNKEKKPSQNFLISNYTFVLYAVHILWFFLIKIYVHTTINHIIKQVVLQA